MKADNSATDQVLNGLVIAAKGFMVAVAALGFVIVFAQMS